jgi:hypothetical protein
MVSMSGPTPGFGSRKRHGKSRSSSPVRLATIVAGQRPVDLTRDEAIAYDFASALVNGGVLPELTYKTAIAGHCCSPRRSR